MSIELDRESFTQWLNKRRYGFIGRCYLPDETPLEGFVRDTFPDQINHTASVHPVQLVGAELVVYTRTGLMSVPLPRWAIRFKIRIEQMMPRGRDGCIPTLSYRQCMEALGEERRHLSFGRNRAQNTIACAAA